MCLILEHTSLAQYGMSHLAIGMVVPIIGSLVVAFSLLCMAKEFTCLLAFQCGDCFYCCFIMLTDIAKGEQRLHHALSYRFRSLSAAKVQLLFQLTIRFGEFNVNL